MPERVNSAPLPGHRRGRRGGEPSPAAPERVLSGPVPIRPYSLDWAVDKLITPVVIGLVLAGFGLLAPGWVAARLQPPTCQDPKDLVRAAPVSATGIPKAPDDFAIKGHTTYEASNLIDGNTSTAWVEGEPGLGLGSQFGLDFSGKVDVQLVCVVNGYAESWDLYRRNSRARLVDIVTDQGRRSSLLADAATPDRPAVYQAANSPQGPTQEITFTLVSAYAAQRDPPTAPAYPDTSVSEVEVWVAK